MKKMNASITVNRVAIFLLLAGSVAYHVHQGIAAKKEHSPASYGFEISKNIFQQTALPFETNPFVLLSK